MSSDAFSRFRASQPGKDADASKATQATASTPDDAAATPSSPFDRFAPKVTPPAPAATRQSPAPSGAGAASSSPFDRFAAKATPPATPTAPAATPDRSRFDAFRQSAASNPSTAAASSSPPSVPPSLNLDAPDAPAASQVSTAPAASGFSLDLSEPSPTAPANTAGPRHTPPTSVLTAFPRLPKGDHVFSPGLPSVLALTRLQSGVGTLRIALDTAHADAFRLGAAVEGVNGTQRAATTVGASVPISRTPSGELLVNLRHIAQIKRALIYVCAKNPTTIWDGLVTLTLPNQSRLHFPLRDSTSHESMAAISLHNVNGELVLRAEADHRDIAARAMCESYGYTQMPWRDDRTPLTA